MRLRLLLPVVFLGGGLGAQGSEGPDLLAVHARGGDAALASAIRRFPESAPSAVNVILQRAYSRTERSASDRDLDAADRIGRSYARVWGDSSLLRGTRAFRSWSREQRGRKLAADRLRRQGNAALPSEGVNGAMAHWTESLRLAWSVPDTAAVAAALGNIGAGFYRAGEPDSAERYLRRALHWAERAGQIRTAANATTTLATLHLDRDRLAAARTLYNDAIRLRRRVGDVRGEAADRNNIGLVDQALGDLAKARASFEESLRSSRRHGLTDASGLSLMNLGNLDVLAGNYSAAASRYESALVAYGTTGNRLDGAEVLRNYGLLELRRGRYFAAAARLNGALKVYEAIGSETQRIQTRQDLASALTASGDLRGATAQLRRMEEVAARAPRSLFRADLALTGAEIAIQFNMLADAAREYERAEDLYVRGSDAGGAAAAREGRAFLLLLRDEFAPARRLLGQVIEAYSAAGDARATASARMLLGVVWRREGKTPSARREFAKAVTDYRAIGDPVGEAAALGESAQLYEVMGDRQRAESLYKHALRLVGTRSRPVSWRLHAGLGRVLQGLNRPREAAARLRAAVADIERLSSVLPVSERRAAYMDDKWEVYAALADVERLNGDAGAAFDISERMRARQTLEVLARAPARPAIAPGSSRGSEAVLRRRVSVLGSYLFRPPGEHRGVRGAGVPQRNGPASNADLLRAGRSYDALLAELDRLDPGYASLARGEVIPWQRLGGRLAPNETLLEYLVSDSATLVFILTSQDVRVIQLKIGRRALAAAIDFARESIRRDERASGDASWRPPLRHLYRELVQPLDERGLLRATRRLIVIPHAELHYLPFAALIRAGQRERFLVEDHEIQVAPSASVWFRLGERGRHGDGRVLALAPRPRSLVGSSEETAAIRRGYGRDADVWTGGKASEQRFRSVARGYGVIHLATAGVLDRRHPLLSFVELRAGGGDDGRLEVHEVFDLPLRARLVVLSACETGLATGLLSDVPAGDDWVGLTNAFLQAGAANVLGTLWRVDDRATARVMHAFYVALRSGRSETASLAAAQRLAIRQPRSSHPFHWAGFVMSGG